MKIANNQVIGVDEVGRGCWAGPLVVVAARASAALPAGLKDSKLLSATKREVLFDAIAETCDIGEGWVMPAEIDRYGLSEAMRMATRQALEALDAAETDKIVMDGNVNYCESRYLRASTVVGADSLFPIVSAASIYAKVLRDRFMKELPERYNVYEFERHVGYGTQLHMRRLKEYGVSDLHRRSFAPVKALL